MKILNRYRRDEWTVAIEAQDINGAIETFYVQIDEHSLKHEGDAYFDTEKHTCDDVNDYFPPGAGEYFDPEDKEIDKIYINFDYAEIVEEAEEFARDENTDH